MKVFIKKLDKTKFEIEVNPQDSVADLKNNIESVKGYPAANQVLVHQGQLLDDRTILDGVAENSVIIMMVSSTPRASVTRAPRSENESGQTASHLVAGSNLDSHNYEQDGLPASAGTMVVNRPAKPVQATQLPAVPLSVPNAEPLNLFPRGLRIAAPGDRNLYFPRNNLGFLRDQRHIFREIVLAHPQTMQPMLVGVRMHNRQLGRLIRENWLDFWLLLVEPLQDPGHSFWLPDSVVAPSRTMTHEDYSTIWRLQGSSGFNILITVEAFLVCNKNEDQADNFLMNCRRGFMDDNP